MNERTKTATSFLGYWGKARPPADGASPGWHPAAYHLLDVAATMDAILEVRPVALRRAARLLGVDDAEARRLMVALAGLHDLGKFAPAFQVKAPELWDALQAELGLPDPIPGQHTHDGYALWVESLAADLADRIWNGGGNVLDILAPAVFGHHGRPVELRPHRARQGFPLEVRHAARDCAEAVVRLVCPDPVEATPPSRTAARIASWYVAGLMTTADWIGSGVKWFPYSPPLPDDPSLSRYWAIARKAAAAAAREAGIVAPPSAPLRPFREVTRLDRDPTPVQKWAASVELPSSPCLVMVEDVTGAGKTEAAQMIVHRLLAAGRAAGAYWGMPTMATANAMYERQAKVLDRLFVEGADSRPSLVLAHGQQRLHSAFRDTVLPGVAAAEVDALGASRAVADTDDELPSSVSCAAFLADDRRAALLADVGVGTIDQALLGVLPSRFNAVRLAGLADKVLVVDEAHAYDAYMSTELEELLRFQSALGGFAVVLSATLPGEQRRRLAAAWADGLRLGGWSGVSRSERQDLQDESYPLATLVSAEGNREFALENARWSRRSVAVRWVNDIEAALDHAQTTASSGAATAWIRNTVDDCLAAAAALRERGLEKVLVFHARFAQCDRQAREDDVLRRFGKGGNPEDRAGWVLVATQVVEQSLDLDFDAMISDLAPVDLLIQRAGRLWRHSERDDVRRQRGLLPELLVVAPPRNPDPPQDWLGSVFRGTAAVYRNHGVLWRTVEALVAAGAIETPDALRGLVEAVYGSDEVPDALLLAAQRAEAKDLGAASTATYGTLKATHGYDAGQQPWVDDLQVPTRMGDEYTTLRLARVQPDGTLAPWADEPVPWRAWALSEVRVRANRVPQHAAALPQYEAAAAAARSQWGRFEQELPILPLSAAGEGAAAGEMLVPDGKGSIEALYSIADGLVFRNER